MKKYISILITLAATLLLGSCSKEDPFDVGENSSATGKFSTAGLRVEIQNKDGLPDIQNRPTRASVPSVDDFTVEFIKEGSETAEASYKYSEMPEIVVLPVGSYIARAHYGENPSAAWESPYYYGESDKFNIVADEITDDVNPIVCKLSNVRVSIVFDNTLKSVMSSDSKVTVKVGESGTLDFTVNDSDRSGYFAYAENSHTLTAVFQGTVEGFAATETKAYDNVVPGNHYRITFRLHSAGEEDPGDITVEPNNIVVDATVEINDMNSNIDIEDDILVDDWRPNEGDDPDDPNPPVTDGPTITAQAPIDLDKLNEVDASTTCILNIHSETGVTAFNVKIESNTLTEDALQEVGLQSTLDLVNPGSLEEALTGLGLPVNVAGQKDIEFNISSFMGLLGALGEGTHNFIMTVTDASGTTVKTLKLHNN